MRYSQRWGGIAALTEAAAYAFGIGLGFTTLAPFLTNTLGPVEMVAFLADHQDLFYLWNQIILVLFGIALVVLVLALHARLQDGAPALMQSATAFGLIWAGLVLAAGMVFNIGTATVTALYSTDPAQAGSLWVAIDAVQTGLGGGNEIVGGLWTLLVSVAALRSGGLPKALNILGILAGAAGLVTVLPGLTDVGALFGLGQLVWFAGLAVVMLRTSPQAAAARPDSLVPQRSTTAL
ncbi:MAG: DUF4386 family protein [Anaerolineales bacterium]|nr:DUF4386 family protein [Anaerolineales bacterium]MCB9129095.1 DUF4386 family protein [Ardenticatenales bacterium]